MIKKHISILLLMLVILYACHPKIVTTEPTISMQSRSFDIVGAWHMVKSNTKSYKTINNSDSIYKEKITHRGLNQYTFLSNSLILIKEDKDDNNSLANELTDTGKYVYKKTEMVIYKSHNILTDSIVFTISSKTDNSFELSKITKETDSKITKTVESLYFNK